MKFSTIVEHDDSGLLMVLDALDELREDRFIEGIRSKQRSHYEIMQMTEYIKERQHRINMEANALTRFSENFIRQFATDNNRCFNTAEKLFGKIRSTIAGLKEVFRQMTPTDRNSCQWVWTIRPYSKNLRWAMTTLHLISLVWIRSHRKYAICTMPLRLCSPLRLPYWHFVI